MTLAIIRSVFVLVVALTVVTDPALAEKQYGPGVTDTELRSARRCPIAALLRHLAPSERPSWPISR